MTLEDLIRIIIEKHNLCKKWFGFTDDDFYTKEQLTKKYHELAKNFHADITNGTDDDMKAINEAYAWLKRFVKDPKDKKYVFYLIVYFIFLKNHIIVIDFIKLEQDYLKIEEQF